MRIAVIADSHFDQHSRFDECVRIHRWIAENAAGRGCTAWLHAGDLYERKSTPAERDAAATWVQHMADVVGPGAIVRGNHDALGDLPLLGRLDTNGRSVTVVEGAQIVNVGGLVVACLSWPQRAWLAASLPSESRERLEQHAGDALRAVLRGLGQELEAASAKAPKVVLSHAMVRGSLTSTGQPLVGHDMEVGLEDLALCPASAYLLGHIHLGQEWDIAGAPAIYPGSPRRTSFGEREAKGYVVLEFDGPHLVSWERVETPCTAMAHLALTWKDGALLEDGCQLHENELIALAGAEVRLRYEVASDQREAARAAAHETATLIKSIGAVLVKVEEVVIAKTRARSPEIANAASLTDKLDAYWVAKSVDVGARRKQLHSMARELEAELRAAS